MTKLEKFGRRIAKRIAKLVGPEEKGLRTSRSAMQDLRNRRETLEKRLGRKLLTVLTPSEWTDSMNEDQAELDQIKGILRKVQYRTTNIDGIKMVKKWREKKTKTK